MATPKLPKSANPDPILDRQRVRADPPQVTSLDPATARLYRALWAAEDAKRARDSKGSK